VAAPRLRLYLVGRRHYTVKRLLVPQTFILIFFALVGSVSFAQDKPLAVTGSATVVDGIVAAGEYSYTQDFGQMKISLNRTADALSIAVVGSTKGWVAVGVGSLRMNGAVMFLGYVDSSGKAQFKVQAGQGHSHSDTTQSVQDTVASYAMKEVNGVTVLELALKPAAYVKAGQTELDLIFAEGSGDSFGPFHTFRGSLPVTLAQ
jgi:hypothetical protein